MIFKNIDAISGTDVLALVTNAVPETKTIEYKRDLPSNEKDATKEFLKDIVAMANTSGGYIFYGIDEKDGVPHTIPGVGDIDMDGCPSPCEYVSGQRRAKNAATPNTRYFSGFRRHGAGGSRHIQLASAPPKQ